MAKEYGASISVDAYFYSLSFPVFIAAIVASYYSYSLVPVLVSKLESKENLKKFYSSNLIFLFILIILYVMAGKIFIQYGLVVNNEMSQLKDLSTLLILGWLIGGAQIIIGYQTASLTAFDKPVYAVILSLFPYIGMLAGLFFLKNGSIINISYGMLIGYFFAILLSFFNLVSFFKPYFRFSYIKELYRSSFYTVLAMTCFSAYSIIDAYWTSFMQSGSLSLISYAQRILIGFGSLVIVAPSMLLVPAFVKRINESINLSLFVYKNILYISLLLLLIFIPLWFYSYQVVSLLFERGGFDASSVLAVSLLLKWMIPGTIFMLLSVILFRLMFALPSLVAPLTGIGILWSVLYFISIAVSYKSGITALAQSYSFSWLIVFVLLLILLYRFLRENNG
jgi:putative peptidoglycan lipid II flippase